MKMSTAGYPIYVREFFGARGMMVWHIIRLDYRVFLYSGSNQAVIIFANNYEDAKTKVSDYVKTVTGITDGRMRHTAAAGHTSQQLIGRTILPTQRLPKSITLAILAKLAERKNDSAYQCVRATIVGDATLALICANQAADYSSQIDKIIVEDQDKTREANKSE